MLDLRQTPQFAEYIKLLGWNVEIIDNSYVFIRKIPVIGSFIKLQRPEKLSKKVIERLDELGKKYRAFQISIEPKEPAHTIKLADYSYKLNKSPSLCTKTFYINLTKSENKILSEMHHKTRYNIKKAIRNKLYVTSSDDIEKFAKFWQGCALKQRHMFLPMKREINAIYTSFGKDAHILFANPPNHEGFSLSSRTNTASEATSGSSISLKRLLRRSDPLNDTATPLAAILLIIADKTAYYMYAASTGQGKKLFAPTLVAWESIKLAKKLGCKLFDFEGIYDERFPLPSWKGFSRFKKGFGGKEIKHPGNFVKYRIPL